MGRPNYTLLLLILISVVFGEASPRSRALGNTGVVISEAGLAANSNPAGLSKLDKHIFYFSFYRPYAGISDAMGVGTIGYAHHFRGLMDIGLVFQYFQAAKYCESEFGLSFSQKLGPIAGGLRLRGIYDSFRADRLDDPSDPVFANGYSKIVFTGNIGLLYNLNKRVNLGLLAENLLNPNNALSAGNESRTGRKITLGAAYNLSRLGTIYAQTGYNSGAPADAQLGIGVGFETDIVHKNLDLRIGICNTDLTSGFGFYIPTSVPTWPAFRRMRIDYAFSYPMSDIRLAATGHRFALIGFIEPATKKPDLFVTIETDASQYPVGDTAIVDVLVTTKHGDDSPIVVHLRAENPVLTLTDSLRISSLSQGKSRLWTVPIPLASASSWNIVASVDPNNEIDETNETNNLTELRFDVFAPPVVKFSASPTILAVEAAEYTYQDESIVPVVFFERGSAEIPERFNPLLDLLAERLENNPDAELIVNGYFDPQTEPNRPDLATARAFAVVKEFVERVPEARERISTGDDDKGRKRVNRTSEYERYRAWINQENRRAEIAVKMPNLRFTINAVEEFDSALATLIATQLERFLRRNPLATITIRAFGEDTNIVEGLNEALRLKEKLANFLEPDIVDRVLVGAPKPALKKGIEIVLLGEGILYKPREEYSTLSFFPEKLPECTLTIHGESRLEIASWRLYLFDTTGQPLWEIDKGKGPPAEQILWNWRGPDGDLLPFGKRFILCLEIYDELGQKVSYCLPEKIGIEVSRFKIRTDRLLLIQFTYDAPAPQSKYLQDRLEEIARDIVERGRREDISLDIEIQGHTDVIGGKRRNLELSDERALAVERLLRVYLLNILGFPDKEALERWMVDNGVAIASKGYADEEPYALSLWSDGELERVIIGQNDTPEGRSINRRVIIVIREICEKGAEDE